MTIAPLPVILVRSAFVVAGIFAWYWTQAVLGKRVPKVAHEVPLTDGIHVMTARLHQRYATNVAAGNRLLIASSLIIDLLGAYREKLSVTALVSELLDQTGYVKELRSEHTLEAQSRMIVRECRLLGRTPLICNVDALAALADGKDQTRLDLVGSILADELGGQPGQACDIAAGVGEARHEPGGHGIGGIGHHDRNRSRHALGGQGRFSNRHDEHIRFEPDELCRKLRIPEVEAKGIITIAERRAAEMRKAL